MSIVLVGITDLGEVHGLEDDSAHLPFCSTCLVVTEVRLLCDVAGEYRPVSRL